jgi:arsenite methyltransferase
MRAARRPSSDPDAGGELLEQVRARYAAAATAAGTAATPASTTDTPVDAAGCCGSSSQDPCCAPDTAAATAGKGFGRDLYDADEQASLPDAAALASLGCGNPTAVADLRAGEVVLDLGSGGGIDVLLSARRVGPTGKAYGLDMTDEMLALARRNATEAGATNVEFLQGRIEAIPLPDEHVDVVISNCVINLSVDKPATLREMYRVLRPGGRVGVSDVVAEDRLLPQERAERGDFVGCIAGAMSVGEYREGLRTVGFTDVDITFTHEVADGLHGAIVRARRP